MIITFLHHPLPSGELSSLFIRSGLFFFLASCRRKLINNFFQHLVLLTPRTTYQIEIQFAAYACCYHPSVLHYKSIYIYMKFHIHNVTLCKNNSVYLFVPFIGSFFVFYFDLHLYVSFTLQSIFVDTDAYSDFERKDTGNSLELAIYNISVWHCIQTAPYRAKYISCGIRLFIYLLYSVHKHDDIIWILSQHVRLLSYKIMLP